MLQLKDITKNYSAGNNEVNALKKVSLTFRNSEFVSILGQSGCGKTTMLNIIGGLDRYTSGDLIINDTSTKKYSARDLDTYRNHTIGFIFQSYNLIPHQSILENVELALSISGISKGKRKAMAVKALESVGLKDQMKKKPNQLSGGQMQRVAIARALVNDPDIILADEPTGALDSETSVQVMNLLKEIAKDKLVIMVTHNPELAKQYSTRIIRMLDGKIVDDSNPVSEEEENTLLCDIREKLEALSVKEKKERKKKAAMSLSTSFRLSLKNLMTKKRRTLITSFACSIGIIGIAVILSVSNGMQDYVDNAQRQSTSANYIMIVNKNQQSMGMMMMQGMEDTAGLTEYPEDTKGVIPYKIDTDAMMKDQNLSQEYVDYIQEKTQGLVIGINYGRDLQMHVLAKDENKDAVVVSTANFTEILDNQEYLSNQYTVLASTKEEGKEIPTAADEVVLVVDSYNRLSTEILDSLNIPYTDELSQIDYKQLLGREFRVVYNDGYYIEDTSNQELTLYRQPAGKEQLNIAYDDKQGMTLKIVSILREKEDASSTWIQNGIGYTKALTDKVLKENRNSEVVKAQLANKKFDVLTGAEFGKAGGIEEMNSVMANQMGMATPSVDVEENLARLGYSTTPSSIIIYPSSFDNKDLIVEALDEWNTAHEGTEDVVDYMDVSEIVATMLGSLIKIITYALTAFSTISLVVSSIMIAIITYASVIERIKEIGILRAMGARKKDISRVFKSEAIILGLISGVIAILFTKGICAIINVVLENLTGVATIASLEVSTGVLMVLLSMGLTLVASLVPAKLAAKKDPVEALRTE